MHRSQFSIWKLSQNISYNKLNRRSKVNLVLQNNGVYKWGLEFRALMSAVDYLYAQRGGGIQPGAISRQDRQDDVLSRHGVSQSLCQGYRGLVWVDGKAEKSKHWLLQQQNKQWQLMDQR